MTYDELVQVRKKYPFEDLSPVIDKGETIILKNPSRIESGIYDTKDELNPWSLWQGDLNAEILVIGQYWGGEICYKEQEGKDTDDDSTNKNLIKLFNSIGIKIRKPSEQYLDKHNQNLFFTNKEIEKITMQAETAYAEWLRDSPNGVYKRGGYNYKNETLISLLNITADEMRVLITIINPKEKVRRQLIKEKEERRNEDGLTKRQQQKQDRLKEILALKEQGLKQIDIAKKIGISRQAVSKLLKSN